MHILGRITLFFLAISGWVYAFCGGDMVEFARIVAIGMGLACVWFCLTTPLALVARVNPRSEGLTKLWFVYILPMGVIIALVMKLMGWI